MPATEKGTSAAQPSEKDRREAFGLAAKDASGFLAPFTFSRRGNGDNDITIKILYCGICHTDLHHIKNEWKDSVYPLVPGKILPWSGASGDIFVHVLLQCKITWEILHEIVGTVTEAGSNVQKLKIGDNVGVGCLVDSCRSCDKCVLHKENYCPDLVFAYNSVDADGKITYGGYSSTIVVDEHFAVKFPENFPLDAGAPLLCAGITVYSPLRTHELNRAGMHLGVVGLGGLGHVALKFGKAFGMKVTVISSSPWKKEEAIGRLGADDFLVCSDAEQMKAARGTMDGIINTVSSKHALLPLILLLKSEGKMIMVGAPEHPLELPALPLLLEGKILAGSCIGGMKETQEMLDFAGEHNIIADIELIGADYVNQAMERLAKGDVRYRFVIDVGNTLAAA